MPDESASNFAIKIYKHVIAGETVGEAIRKARLKFREQRPNDITWAAFILYGDPTLKLQTRH